MSNTNSEPLDSYRSLVKSTSILGVGTLASRLLGFVRDMILAQFFGTGFRADAFFLALRIPNLFREMVGEGAANSAVVPVLSEYQLKKDTRNFWRLVNGLALWALIILSAITLLGMIFTPTIVRFLAPGFIADPVKLKLAIDLTRMIFPYLILIGLTAHSMAVLFTFRSFTAPAFSPCLFNIAIIVAALWSAKFLQEPTYGLAVGVLVGGILQLAVQIPSLLKRGLCWPKRLPEEKTSLSHPGAKQCSKLLVPRLFGSSVYQMNLLVDTFCASLSSVVGLGGISAIYYSNRLIQLPLGVFGFAMAAAALPALSAMAAQKEMEKFKRTVVFSLENIFFIMFPTSIMMMLLSEPLIRVLFQRGEFDAYSTNITSLALTFFALGLFSFGGTKIVTTAFYALQDTQTPVKVAAGCLVLNIILNLTLMWRMKIAGIALASSLASALGFFCLFYLLERRIGVLRTGFKRYVWKIILASLLAGIAIVILGLVLYSWMVPELLKLAVLSGTGVVVYFTFCAMFHVHQVRLMFGSLKFKSKGAGQVGSSGRR